MLPLVSAAENVLLLGARGMGLASLQLLASEHGASGNVFSAWLRQYSETFAL
jgi:transposase-like protein